MLSKTEAGVFVPLADPERSSAKRCRAVVTLMMSNCPAQRWHTAMTSPACALWVIHWLMRMQRMRDVACNVAPPRSCEAEEQLRDWNMQALGATAFRLGIPNARMRAP
eukprot:CAMPEP_0171081990 /NCGR_PEP_ID=MMETSP0766_2-20121228/16835_1 /TAXON_ID=439317 /ORGANISM="Gambierdiscus australes, Strain CAWD 149" /LENGTH=107 /DNA_ID=CAMNT_0011539327 /DNA_START=349 /DNA_END=668 /DNA_ORIENTATION=+